MDESAEPVQRSEDGAERGAPGFVSVPSVESIGLQFRIDLPVSTEYEREVAGEPGEREGELLEEAEAAAEDAEGADHPPGEPEAAGEAEGKGSVGYAKELEDEDDNDNGPSEQLEQINRGNLKLIWYSIAITEQWTPSMREGATLMHFDALNKCYMYGGIGRDLFNNFVVLNLKNWTWENIGPGSGDAP